MALMGECTGGGSSMVVPTHQGEGSEVIASIAEDVRTVGAACRPGVISDPRVAELRDFVDRAFAADIEWHAPDDLEYAGRVTFLSRCGARRSATDRR